MKTEKRKFSGTFRIYLGLLIFSIAGSALSYTFDLDPGWIRPVASALTLIFGCLAALQPMEAAYGFRRILKAVIFVLLIGAASEIIGLYTGLPFGRYQYTQAWWPTIPLPDGKFFPLQLPIAWLLITAGSLALGSKLWPQPAKPSGALATAVMGGFIAALVDIPMEFVMTEILGYWHWADSNWPLGGSFFGAPYINFFGWWFVGTLSCLILGRVVTRPLPNRQGVAVLLLHLGFVISIWLLWMITGG